MFARCLVLRSGSLMGEEQLVYNTIRASANEGIWTKHLKSKTNLHEAVIKRCLRTLEHKAMVKAIKSVKVNAHTEDVNIISLQV